MLNVSFRMKWVLLHLTMWLVYFVIVIFYKTNNLGLPYALEHSCVAGALNIIYFYLIAELAVKRFLVKHKYGRFVLSSLIATFIFFIIKLNIEVANYQAFFDLNSHGSEIREKIIVLGTLITTFLMSMILTILKNSIDKERAVKALINRQNEAKLSYLKSQINPHFLFNTLHNIYSLSMVKSDKAPKAVIKLSDLLRYSIYGTDKKTVSLATEAIQIKNFLELFQLSQESPRSIIFNTSGDLASHEVEPMILIPLVENCIKHTDFSTNKNAFITLNLEVETHRLKFSAKNSKTVSEPQHDTVGGVGLKNIKQRLDLRYGEGYSFQIDGKTDVFSVCLVINK